jgi:hypothetical protein
MPKVVDRYKNTIKLIDYHRLEIEVVRVLYKKPHSYKNSGRTTAVGVSVVFFSVD